MILLALAALAASLPGVPALAGGARDGMEGVEIAQMTITQSVVIRVPARRSRHYAEAPPAPATPIPPAFREKKGPKCIDADLIAGAAITTPASVDVILKGGQRLRAQLEDACPALDYYSGFYVHPGADGKICADRDSIRTRSGGDCQIDRFRLLVPVSKH